MEVFVVGNPDIPEDALPLRVLPQLKNRFPRFRFTVLDPNEEWNLPDRAIILDSVVRIDRVTTFSDLASFTRPPRVTLHDFDLYAQLRFLEKLGRLPEITIVGIPPTISSEQALQDITTILRRASQPRGSARRNSCRDHRPE